MSAPRPTRGSRALLLALLTASLIRAVAVLCLPAVCGRALDSAPAATASPREWVGTAIGLMVLIAACESAASVAAGIFVADCTARSRRRMVAHVLAVGPDLLRGTGAGDVVTRLVGNAAQAAGAPVRVATAAVSLLPVLGGLALMCVIDLWCGAVFGCGLAALAVLSRKLLTQTRAANTGYLAAQGRIADALTETVSGARTVAAAGTAATERRRVLAALPELHSNGRRLWHIQAAAIGRGTVLMPLLQVVVLAIAGCRVAAGQLTVGALFAISGYLALGVRLIATLSQLAALGGTRAAANRCTTLLQAPVQRYGTAGSTGPGTLRVRDVTVDRPDLPALRRVEVTIPAGQRVALAGDDGSGCSTFAGLIGRMIDPDAGAVLLDDLDLRQLTREALHGSVTYAFDRPALLGATIAESIGLRTTPVEPTVIAAAARAACAAEFITRLPAGYATPLRAAPMSGGEMQRLGLARAFAHPARVLVLDDATSSLDTVTEHKISTALAAAAGRTRIVLARRASTAAHSDRVLWFDSGRIRGDGIHQDLWADPAYRAVFEAAPVRANVEFACRAAAFAL